MKIGMLAVALLASLLAFSPGSAFADDGKDADGLLLRVSGDVTVQSGQTVGSVVVIKGNATIEGTVKNSVVVIKGTAVITGTVAGDLTVISGTLDLRNGSSVKNVNTVGSDLLRADGAIVTGKITENSSFEFPTALAAALSILFWVSMTFAVVVAGLIFAAVGGKQLNEAARAMTGDAVNTIIGMVMVWCALPVLAVVAIVTLVGIPLGLGMLLFLLPALWFLGYLVAGASLGSFIFKGSRTQAHPFAATTLGLVLFQLLVLVPFVGVVVALLAGFWGAGALAYIAYRAAGGKGVSSQAPRSTSQPAPAT